MIDTRHGRKQMSPKPTKQLKNEIKDKKTRFGVEKDTQKSFLRMVTETETKTRPNHDDYK